MVSIHPDLFQILRGYASLVPPNRLQFPAHPQTQIIHDFLVDQILLNAHFQKYPPSPEYQRSFWKWIISQLEQRMANDVGRSLPSILRFNLPVLSLKWKWTPAYMITIWNY
jgi:hypothetical protein